MSISDEDYIALDEHVSKIDTRLRQVETELHANTQATARIEKNTEDIVIAFDALRGAFKVLEFIGKIGKPLLVVSGAVTGTIAIWQGVKTFLHIT